MLNLKNYTEAQLQEIGQFLENSMVKGNRYILDGIIGINNELYNRNNDNPIFILEPARKEVEEFDRVEIEYPN